MDSIETNRGRFFIGGVGALFPLAVTLINADLASLIDNPDSLTRGQWVGHAIQYVALFVLGGFVAWLQSDEKKPMKILQIGIAAPALAAQIIAGAGNGSHKVASQVNESSTVAFRLISSAHAAETKPPNNPPPGGFGVTPFGASTDGSGGTASGSFWSDVVNGLTHPLPAKGLFAGKESDPSLGLLDRVCKGDFDLGAIPEGEVPFNTEVELKRAVPKEDFPAVSRQSFTMGAIPGKSMPTISVSTKNGCVGYVAQVSVGKPREDHLYPVNIAFEEKGADGVLKSFKGQVFAKENEPTKVTQWGDVTMTIKLIGFN